MHISWTLRHLISDTILGINTYLSNLNTFQVIQNAIMRIIFLAKTCDRVTFEYSLYDTQLSISYSGTKLQITK